MRTKLQQLRDEAERRALYAAEQSDRDSADAWERIGLAIDDCQRRIGFDLQTVEERMGMFDRAAYEGSK